MKEDTYTLIYRHREGDSLFAEQFSAPPHDTNGKSLSPDVQAELLEAALRQHAGRSLGREIEMLNAHRVRPSEPYTVSDLLTGTTAMEWAGIRPVAIFVARRPAALWQADR